MTANFVPSLLIAMVFIGMVVVTVLFAYTLKVKKDIAWYQRELYKARTQPKRMQAKGHVQASPLPDDTGGGTDIENMTVKEYWNTIQQPELDKRLKETETPKVAPTDTDYIVEVNIEGRLSKVFDLMALFPHNGQKIENRFRIAVKSRQLAEGTVTMIKNRIDGLEFNRIRILKPSLDAIEKAECESNRKEIKERMQKLNASLTERYS